MNRKITFLMIVVVVLLTSGNSVLAASLNQQGGQGDGLVTAREIYDALMYESPANDPGPSYYETHTLEQREGHIWLIFLACVVVIGFSLLIGHGH